MMSLKQCVKKGLLSYLSILALFIAATAIHLFVFKFISDSGSLFNSKASFSFVVNHCAVESFIDDLPAHYHASMVITAQSEQIILFERWIDSQYGFEQEVAYVAEFMEAINHYGCHVVKSSVVKDFQLAGMNDLLYLMTFLFCSALAVYLITRRKKSFFYSDFHQNLPKFNLQQVGQFAGFGAVLACAVMVVNILFYSFIASEQAVENMPGFQGFSLSILLTVILVGPLAEELVFRRLGYQVWLRGRKSEALLGALIVSWLFALFHSGVLIGLGFNFLMFFYSYIASLLLCYAYLKSGYLAASACHIAFNLTSVTLYLVYNHLLVGQ